MRSRNLGTQIFKISFLVITALYFTGCLETSGLTSGAANTSDASKVSFSGCLDAKGVTTSAIQVQYEWPNKAQSVSILRNGIIVSTQFSGSSGIYSDEGLLEGKTYTYTCSAVFKNENNSLLTTVNGANTVSASTVSVHAPTFDGLTSVTAESSTSVRLRWGVADGVPTQSYTAIAKLGSAPTENDFDITNATTSTLISAKKIRLLTLNDPYANYAVLTDIGEQLNYYYAVRACSAAGNCTIGTSGTATQAFSLPNTSAPLTTGVTLVQLIDGQIVLTAPWIAPQGQVSLRRVYRNTTGGTDINTYVNVQNISVTDSNHVANTITMSGTLSEGSTYYYIVRDEDQDGNLSSNMQVASITIGDLTPPPDFPGIRPAGDLTSTTQGQILVKWGAPADWSDYRGFRIFTMNADNSLNYIKDCICVSDDCVTNHLTQCLITDLDPFRTYKFHVKAFDHAGNITTYLNPISSYAAKRALDSTPPVFVSGLSVGYASGITLTWSAATDNQYPAEPGAILQYQVWRKTGSPFVAPTVPSADADGGTPLIVTTSLNYLDTAIVSGSSYFYTICALDGTLNQKCDGNVGFRTVPDITPPTIGTITSTKTTTNKIWNLNWTINDNVTPAAQLSVTVRRKVASTSSEFPTTSDDIYLAGQNMTSLTSEGQTLIAGTANVAAYINYLVQVSDLAGNTTTATYSVYLDNRPPSSAPVLTAFSPTSPSQTSSTPIVTGTLSANSANVSLYSDVLCTTLLASGTKADFEGAGLTVLLSQNSSTTIYAQAKTAASTIGACTSLGTFVHDNQVPTLASLTINGAAFRGISDLQWSITWGAATSDVASYCILQNSNTLASCSWVNGSSFPTTFTATAIEGSNYFSAWVRDGAGNVSSRVSSNTITVDATPPVFANSLTVPTWTVNASALKDIAGTTLSVTVSLNATDNNAVDHYEYAVGTGTSGVTLNNIKAWSTISTGTFSPTGMTLFHNNHYYINVRAIDTAGNSTIISKDFAVDLVDPQTPQITSVYENQNVVVPGAGLIVTGACESGTGNITTTSAGSQAFISSSSCVSDTLSLTLQTSGLSFGVSSPRQFSAYTTKPSGRVSGTATRIINAIGSCPTNYLAVGGSAFYGTVDFCIAKYEAKAVTSNPTLGSATLYNGGNGSGPSAGNFPESRPDGTPWTIVTQRSAIILCDRLNSTTGGTGRYQLITNAQWQTVAQNVTSVAANWSSGTPGTGTMASGHTDYDITDAAQGTTAGLSYSTGGKALAAASMDGTSYPATFANAAAELAAGYRGTGNSTSSGWTQRRTLMLTSGEVIWDLSGNVMEFTRFTQPEGTLDSGLAGNSASTFNSRLLPAQSDNAGSTGSRIDINSPNIYSDVSGTGGILSKWFRPYDFPSLSGLTSRMGVYTINSGAVGMIPTRGGANFDLGNYGVYHTTSSFGPGTNSDITGFRCVFNP